MDRGRLITITPPLRPASSRCEIHNIITFNTPKKYRGLRLVLLNPDRMLRRTARESVRVKARVGYDAGAFLPYVTGGVVRANTSGPDLEVDGDFYGLGVAYKYADNILFGGEVLQHKFY